MTPKEPMLEALQNQVVAWAQGEPAIRACLLVGSRARITPPADDHSDIDLIFFADDFTPYTSSPDWIRQFGDVWVHVFEPTGGGDPEYLVVYEGGCKIDVVFWPLSILDAPLDDGKRGVLARGFRVLFDKTGRTAAIPPASGHGLAQSPSSAEEFDRVVRQFWYTAYQADRWLRRRERWVGQYQLSKLRADWLTMASWSMQAAHGSDYDTWYMGRFIESWLDADDQVILSRIFPMYTDAAIRESLTLLCADFRRHAHRVAQAYGYEYPAHTDQAISTWISRE